LAALQHAAPPGGPACDYSAYTRAAGVAAENQRSEIATTALAFRIPNRF